jgi:hypothetical protein
MRRLVLLSVLLLAVIAFAVWLVLPMFLTPRATTLAECRLCPALLGLAPEGVPNVVVVPRGGTTLFEVGRRIVPSREISRILPAPGLLAIGLGDAPVVLWKDGRGELGGAAAPSGLRRLLLRLATYRYGGAGIRWHGGWIHFGAVGATGGAAALPDLSRLEGLAGHGFAVHDSPAGVSVAVLGPKSLEIRTFPVSATVASRMPARHPADAVLSLAAAEIDVVVRPIEKILPLRTAAKVARPGQIVIYDLDASGLLPSIRGLLLVAGEADARGALERAVPRVEGATLDSTRRVGSVEIHRRETLGLVVEAAVADGFLAFAFDASSMDRWLASEARPDPVESAWSASIAPAPLAEALDELTSSPARALLGSSARRTVRRLRDAVGPLRSASRISSRLVDGANGPEIHTRVDW